MSKRDRDAAAAADPPVEEPVVEGEVVDVTEGAAGDPAASDGAPPTDAHGVGDPASDADPADGAEDAIAEGAAGADSVGPDGSVADAAEAVEADLAELARERDEYLDSLRRLQADFENFKKRSIRQQTEALDRAAEGLVQKLLPVLDAIDLARQHGAGEGVDQIANALTDVLTKEGLERVGEPGDAFDPNVHEAVAHEEGDGGEATLAEVMRAGWSWKGRLLRAAMVKVRG